MSGSILLWAMGMGMNIPHRHRPAGGAESILGDGSGNIEHVSGSLMMSSVRLCAGQAPRVSSIAHACLVPNLHADTIQP